MECNSGLLRDILAKRLELLGILSCAIVMLRSQYTKNGLL